MKRRPSRSVLLSGSLVLAAIGLSTQAQQADLVAVEQLRKEMTDAVLRAFGLDEPPSLDRPRPSQRATEPPPAPAGAMSKLELQMRRILGIAPAGSPAEDATRLAAAPADAGAAPAATDAAAGTPGPRADAGSPPSAATEPAAVATAAPTPAPAPALSSPPASTPLPTAAATATVTAESPAADGAAAQQPIAVALDDGALDSLRGGFIGEGGLRISFGIERAVYVNGNLVTTTSLNLSELGTLAAGKGAALSPAQLGNSIALIQNGAGNTVLSNLGPAAIGTVIQNTLNGQKIQTLTTINATVNSLGVLRSIEAQRNLRGAITDSLRR